MTLGSCFHGLARLSGLAVAGLFVASTLGAAKWKEPSAAEKQIVEDSAQGLLGGVYLEKTMRSTYQALHVSVRAKILSKAGFDIGTVNDLPSDSYDIEGRTVGTDGKATELSRKDVRRMTKVKAAGSSYETLGFTMPALEPGCFVEYSYTERGWLGSAGAYHIEILFQDKYRTLRQELRTPKTFPYLSTVRSTRVAKVAFRTDGSEIVYEASNTPGVREEPYELPRSERFSAVIFAWAFIDVYAKTPDEFWPEIAHKGFAPLFKKVLVRPSRVQRVLQTVAGSRTSDAPARLRAIYRWVQKNLKNETALAASETSPKGGWKTNDDAADTLEHGAGRPSDLAAVCESLLRADGWHIRAVFTPDREERHFHREIQSFFQFNGWILEARDPGLPQPVYLAFDHPLLPFGIVPWSRLGVQGLAFDPETETTEMLTLPTAPADSSLCRRAWKVGLGEDGDVRVDRQNMYTGVRAFEQRADLYRKGHEASEKELRESYAKLDPPCELESVAFDREEALDDYFVVHTRYVRRGAVTALPGGRIEFAPLASIAVRNPFTADNRIGPIEFAYPYRDEDKLTITPPPGYAIEGLPKGTDHPSNVGRYEIRVSPGDGGTVVVSRVFEITRAFSGPELYASYRAIFEKAAQADSGLSLVFRKAAAKAGS